MKFYKKYFTIYNTLRSFLRFKRNFNGIGNVIIINGVVLSRSRLEIDGSDNNFILNCRIDKLSIKIIGDNNKIEFGNNSTIVNSSIYINGNSNNITLGEKCNLKQTHFWIEDNNCKIEIGDKTSIESAQLAATEDNSEIVIGEDCMFSYDIEIRTGDSHSILDQNTKKRINQAKSVFIGNHVWIGAKVIILKGVNIEDNVVIGTGSIVTNYCPNNSIMSGIPAKIIKDQITWCRQRI